AAGPGRLTSRRLGRPPRPAGAVAGLLTARRRCATDLAGPGAVVDRVRQVSRLIALFRERLEAQDAVIVLVDLVVSGVDDGGVELVKGVEAECREALLEAAELLDRASEADL